LSTKHVQVIPDCIPCLTKDCRFPSGGARECLHRTIAPDGSRDGKGEAACTVLYTCTAYVTSQQEKVSEVRHRHALARRDIISLMLVTLISSISNVTGCGLYYRVSIHARGRIFVFPTTSIPAWCPHSHPAPGAVSPAEERPVCESDCLPPFSAWSFTSSPSYAFMRHKANIYVDFNNIFF
jgi:hypothetical protein